MKITIITKITTLWKEEEFEDDDWDDDWEEDEE